jgi:hypothetical protein
LGEAAARIHRAADDFAPSAARGNYDAAVVVDEQPQRMHRLLVQAGRWQQTVALGERLKRRLAEPTLDWGICHMDLTLDNVHLAEDLTVRLRQRGNVLASCGTVGCTEGLRDLLSGLVGRIPNSSSLSCSRRGGCGSVRNRR